MTKERKLAIKMWEGIRDMLIDNNVVSRIDIITYKCCFCAQNDLNWPTSCWFCQYMPRCSKCPLKSCSDGLYGIVLADYKEKNVRIDACNNIIKALGGKV